MRSRFSQFISARPARENVEQAVDETFHAIAGLEDLLEEGPAFLVERRTALVFECLGESLEDAQRAAQVVAGGRVNVSNSLLARGDFVFVLGQILDAGEPAARYRRTAPERRELHAGDEVAAVRAPHRHARDGTRPPRICAQLSRRVRERTPSRIAAPSARGVGTQQTARGGIRGVIRPSRVNSSDGTGCDSNSAPALARIRRLAGQDFFHEIRHMSVAIWNRPSAASLDSAPPKTLCAARNSAPAGFRRRILRPICDAASPDAANLRRSLRNWRRTPICQRVAEWPGWRATVDIIPQHWVKSAPMSTNEFEIRRASGCC